MPIPCVSSGRSIVSCARRLRSPISASSSVSRHRAILLISFRRTLALPRRNTGPSRGSSANKPRANKVLSRKGKQALLRGRFGPANALDPRRRKEKTQKEDKKRRRENQTAEHAAALPFR